MVAAPNAGLEEIPVEGINDATLPIEPPRASPEITWWLGILVFAGLIVLIAMAILALV